MMELIFAIAIMSLAATGLALGLILGRSPALTSCSAAAFLPEGRCADCPLRRQNTVEDSEK